MDGIGTVAVSDYLSFVLGMFVDLEFEGLALGWRLDESAIELNGGAHDGLGDLGEVLRCLVDHDLDVGVAAAIVDLNEAALLLSPAVLYPTSHFDFLIEKLFVSLENSSNSYTLSEGHGRDGLFHQIVVPCELSRVLFNFPA